MLAACGTCSTLKLAVNLVFRQVSAIPVVARVAAEDPTGPSKRTGRKPFQVRVTRHSSYACKDAGRKQCHAAGGDKPRHAQPKSPGAACHTQVLLCGPPWVYVALCPCGSRLTSSADGVIWMLGVPLLLAPLLPTGCAVLLPL